MICHWIPVNSPSLCPIWNVLSVPSNFPSLFHLSGVSPGTPSFERPFLSLHSSPIWPRHPVHLHIPSLRQIFYKSWPDYCGLTYPLTHLLAFKLLEGSTHALFPFVSRTVSTEAEAVGTHYIFIKQMSKWLSLSNPDHSVHDLEVLPRTDPHSLEVSPNTQGHSSLHL